MAAFELLYTKLHWLSSWKSGQKAHKAKKKKKNVSYLVPYRKFVDPWFLAIFSKACHHGTYIPMKGSEFTSWVCGLCRGTGPHDWLTALLSPSWNSQWFLIKEPTFSSPHYVSVSRWSKVRLGVILNTRNQSSARRQPGFLFFCFHWQFISTYSFGKVLFILSFVDHLWIYWHCNLVKENMPQKPTLLPLGMLYPREDSW